MVVNGPWVYQVRLFDRRRLPFGGSMGCLRPTARRRLCPHPGLIWQRPGEKDGRQHWLTMGTSLPAHARTIDPEPTDRSSAHPRTASPTSQSHLSVPPSQQPSVLLSGSCDSCQRMQTAVTITSSGGASALAADGAIDFDSLSSFLSFLLWLRRWRRNVVADVQEPVPRAGRAHDALHMPYTAHHAAADAVRLPSPAYPG